jgi:hypothetical protein
MFNLISKTKNQPAQGLLSNLGTISNHFNSYCGLVSKRAKN